MVPPSLTYADAAASGVSNSGNNSVNYSPPTHPAFPFTGTAGAVAGASPMMMVAGGLLVVAIIFAGVYRRGK